MYGEEFYQNSIHNSHHDDTIGIVSCIIDHNIENDQRSKGGDTPAAQYSGGDDETENEDQVDHVGIYSNGFSPYTNFREHYPKGDFSFGDNDLDLELDAISIGNDSSQIK